MSRLGPWVRIAAIISMASMAVLLTACGSTAQAAKKKVAKNTSGAIELSARTVDMIGGVSSSQIKKIQKKMLEFAAQSSDPIWLRIDTPGGSVGAGLILINTFEALEAPVYCLVEGKAYSMGAILLTYCDRKYGYRHSTYMMHEASYGTSGEDPQNRSKFEFLTGYLDRLHHEVAKNIGMDHDTYRPKIRDAWWLLADEAKRVGLIDAIVDKITYNAGQTLKHETKETLTREQKLQTYPDGTAAPKIPKRSD